MWPFGPGRAERERIANEQAEAQRLQRERYLEAVDRQNDALFRRLREQRQTQNAATPGERASDSSHPAHAVGILNPMISATPYSPVDDSARSAASGPSSPANHDSGSATTGDYGAATSFSDGGSMSP